MGRKFTMIDESFHCKICGFSVETLKYTARDHCPICLCSLHVDVFPGDRESTCQGILNPVGVEKYKEGYKIIYRCEKCGNLKKNIAAIDDNMDLIIQLSARPIIDRYN